MTLIAITMRSIRDGATGELRDSLSRDWIEYLDSMGFDLFPVPNGISKPDSVLKAANGLILSNGEDIGEYPDRDRTEKDLLQTALDDSIPTLGVCRGHQVVNNYFGGEIVDIQTQNSKTHSHSGESHTVDILESPVSTRLRERLFINSFHRRGIYLDQVAPPLEPFAITAKDGIVEGLYHPEYRLMSVQWHPERPLQSREPVDEMFSSFIRGELSW